LTVSSLDYWIFFLLKSFDIADNATETRDRNEILGRQADNITAVVFGKSIDKLL